MRQRPLLIGCLNCYLRCKLITVKHNCYKLYNSYFLISNSLRTPFSYLCTMINKLNILTLNNIIWQPKYDMEPEVTIILLYLVQWKFCLEYILISVLICLKTTIIINVGSPERPILVFKWVAICLTNKANLSGTKVYFS